jgi:hypothetical protein
MHQTTFFSYSASVGLVLNHIGAFVGVLKGRTFFTTVKQLEKVSVKRSFGVKRDFQTINFDYL